MIFLSISAMSHHVLHGSLRNLYIFSQGTLEKVRGTDVKENRAKRKTKFIGELKGESIDGLKGGHRV